MIEANRQGDVWVVAEQNDGELEDVGLELLSKGRELAERLGVRLTAVVLGAGEAGHAERLIHHGADRVLVAEHPLLAHYQSNSYAKVLCRLIEEHKPQIVIYGATPLGRDLAPRVASAIRAGLTADCTDLDIGDHVEPTTRQKYDRLLYQVRPAFGGNIIATIVNPERWPQMATVREGVMRMPDADPARRGEVVRFTPDLAPADLPLEILEHTRAERKVNLKAARIIVAGGAGVGSKENFRLIWDLANALGAAAGASRAAVDSGWIDKDHQVGQTGTTVRPALYIAIGISGAVQHRAGMSEAQKIVAINADPDAPIFQVAHYGIVGDLNRAVPMMIDAIKRRV
ncbi:MAG: electron transfer flavoprotein subunit alpha/FixB family protein [Phycisphaerae bacterium]